jgi:8-oxo-dGTP diphosphatase
MMLALGSSLRHGAASSMMAYSRDTMNRGSVTPVLDFPMKYLSAGALFFNAEGQLLLVKPTYKEGWEIPGGIVEADESPKQACVREIAEELGLRVEIGPLLVMDYKSRSGGRSDSLQFVFLGGSLTPDQVRAIRLPAGELTGYEFLAPEAALRELHTSLSLRVAGCLRAIAEGRTVLLHDGQEA